MKTTNLFVEVMIVGGQVFTWGLLAAMFFFHLPAEDVRAVFANPVSWAPVLAICYILGILFDNGVHERLFRKRQRRIRHNVIMYRTGKEGLSEDECSLLWRKVRKAALEMPTSYAAPILLGYVRHRVRILRGTVVNVPFIGIFGALVLHRHSGSIPISLSLVGFAVVVTVLGCFAWRRFEHSWSVLSYDWYAICRDREPPNTSA